MPIKLPLVLEGGDLKQLQPGEELDIPLDARVVELERKFALLILSLEEVGIDLPAELLEEIQTLK